MVTQVLKICWLSYLGLKNKDLVQDVLRKSAVNLNWQSGNFSFSLRFYACLSLNPGVASIYIGDANGTVSTALQRT